MQIYYCETCGLRVNNAEMVAADDEKVFCLACATKAGIKPGQRLPTGVQNTLARPRSGGFKTMTPGKGVPVQAEAPARSSPDRGTPLKLAAAPAPAEARPRPAQPASTEHKTRGNTAVRSAPSAANNQSLLWAGIGGGAMLVVVLALFVFGGGKNPEPANPKQNAAKTPEQSTQPVPLKDTGKAGTEPAKANTNKTVDAAKETPRPGLFAPAQNDTVDDIRERVAASEWQKLHADFLKVEPQRKLIARKNADLFLHRYRSTKAGAEAAAFFSGQEHFAPREPDSVGATQPGLRVKMYERPKEWDEIRGKPIESKKLLKELVLQSFDYPNRGALKGPLGREEYFVLVFTGYFEAPADGEYTFGLHSDDGSLLWIGDWAVIENDGAHGMEEVTNRVPLKKGKHALRLHYSQGQGESGLKLFVGGPGLSFKIAPPNLFSHTK